MTDGERGMLYRVKTRETGSKQPSGTYWRNTVIYIGHNVDEARIAFHREEPQDFGGGYGNRARETVFEILADEELPEDDAGWFERADADDPDHGVG
jgi:hypothetical protein